MVNMTGCAENETFHISNLIKVGLKITNSLSFNKVIIRIFTRGDYALRPTGVKPAGVKREAAS
ncbi:MAG: hypothetical protein ABRQ29_05585 [Smithellaceae bacterium]